LTPYGSSQKYSHGIPERVGFPAIRTFRSLHMPRRGDRFAVPSFVELDFMAIAAALAAAACIIELR